MTPHPYIPTTHGGVGVWEPTPVRTVVLPHMTCLQFRERYSDYRDGLITSERELRRFQRHFAHCPACRRYDRSEEHTSELQSRPHLVCRLLLEKKNLINIEPDPI